MRGFFPTYGLTTLFLFGCAEKTHIMSWREYSAHTYTWPYTASISAPHGELFYFGARHSNDPSDNQFSEIQAQWERLKPEIAFNEGGNPPTEKIREQAIQKHGEPGFVRFLAARDGIPVRSIDPTTADEVEALRTKFTPEQIKMFFILRQMTEYGRILKPNESLEEYLQNTISFLNRVPGIQVAPKSVEELELSFRVKFPDLGSYKNANADWFDPVKTKTIFNKIARASSDFRDKHMVGLISNAVCEQKRVFAVVGASHVVMQEQAIRKLVAEKCSR
jgi:hypothetical protein